MIFALLCLAALAVGAAFLLRKPKGRNPFAEDHRRPRDARVLDPETRNKRLKQGYRKDLVPADLDAIVVGAKRRGGEGLEEGWRHGRKKERKEKERDRQRPEGLKEAKLCECRW